MRKLFKGNHDEFIPNCKPIGTSHEGAVETWECNPEERINGKIVKVERPVLILREREDNKLLVKDSGGANTRQLEKLFGFLEDHM